MTPIQKILYDSLRSFGYCYISQDADDGTINLDTRPPSHRIALFSNGLLYQIVDDEYQLLSATK